MNPFLTELSRRKGTTLTLTESTDLGVLDTWQLCSWIDSTAWERNHGEQLSDFKKAQEATYANICKSMQDSEMLTDIHASDARKVWRGIPYMNALYSRPFVGVLCVSWAEESEPGEDGETKLALRAKMKH